MPKVLASYVVVDLLPHEGFLGAIFVFFGPLFWILLNLIWGTLQVLYARGYLPEDIRKAKNSWGFGQLISLLLVALHFAAVSNAYYGS